MITLFRYRPGNLLDAMGDFRSYDEWPVLHPDMDPQVHVSRNSVPQPHHLCCEHDSVLAVLAGTGRVELKRSSVNEFRLRPGDHVYVPGWTPHRIVPVTPLYVVRYKARAAGREAVAWFCDGCGAEVWHAAYDTAIEVPQRAWLRAVERFNGDEVLRTCGCGVVHPVVETGDARWAEVADAIDDLVANAPADDPMYAED